jgi:hypothetical protein
MFPAIASAIRNGRVALKDPCVNSRWYPAVTPSPVSTKKNAPKAMSSPLSPHPQANGTATASASIGSTTNTVMITCSGSDVVPEVIGLAGRAWVSATGMRTFVSMKR